MSLKIIRELGAKISLVFDKKSAQETKNKLEEIAEVLQHTSLRVAEVTGALFGFAKAASSNARELEEYSEQLGINTDRLQEMEYAAKVVAHVNREELMGSFEGISKTMFDARNGNLEALKSLDRLQLGMDFMNDSTVTADKVMMKLADGLKNVQNPMAKMGVLSAVGISPKMLPLLKMGSKGIADMGVEARKMGVVLDGSMIAKGREFDQTLSRMWIILKNVTFTVGHELIKYFEPLVNEWAKFVVVNKNLIASGIGGFMKSMSFYLMIVLKTVVFMVDRLKFLVQLMGGLERVTKMVAIAMGIFTAGKLIASVGSFISMMRGLVALMMVLDIQAIAIAAAFMGLILVVQDLFSDDSMIKEWIGTFADEFPNAAKLVSGAFSLVKTAVMDAVGAFSTVFGWIEKGISLLGDFAAAIDKVAHIKDAVKGAMGVLGKIGGVIGEGMGSAGDFMQSAVARPTPGANNVTSSNSTQQSFEANVSVTVPPGTTGKAAASMVSDGVQDAFDNLFRRTKNQATGGVAY